MKKRKVDPWFPFWIDKWLFGSTRLELEPDERGVFVDLMAFSKKDDGWIRANEGVPYLESQLCGFFNIKPELLQRTINKCIKYGKAKKLKDGTIYMTSHDVYKLSPRQERRVETEMAENGDIVAEKADAILNKNKQDKIRKKIKEEEEKKYKKEFDIFMKIYGLNVAREDAFNAFKALRRKGITFETIKDAVKGYANHLKNESWKKQMYPATFLRKEKWKDFVGVKYTPSL